MSREPDRTDIFSERLLAAFLHLSAESKESIRVKMEQLGIGGGLKAGVARLVGIRTQSLLSDMLAGRAKGHRYRKQLSDLLGVSESWLSGDDADPPDWCLQPGEAYQRYARRVRRAWSDKRGKAVGEVVEAGDDDSSRNRLWTVWLDDNERTFHAEQADRHLVAQGVGLEKDGADADWLAACRYERVPLDLLVRFGEWLGVPRPPHPDVPREGHKAIQVALAHQEWLAKAIQARIDRAYLPPHLFTLTRHALLRERMEYQRSGRDTTELEDALELLWRQQLRRDRRQDHGAAPVPPEFTTDTGRAAWTDLRVLQNRRRLERQMAPLNRMRRGFDGKG